MTDFRDHFASQAPDYAAFRPTYPQQFIARLAALAPARELAWDAGTGNGQAAVMLAAHFARVHATDASARQVAHATAHPGVAYAVAPAEHSRLGDASVDLVAVAQALHWFTLDSFYAEVERVLRPGGVLAAWSYGLPTIDPEVDRVVAWFYGDRLGRYWPPERRHVETRYAELPFPYPDLDVGEWGIDAALTRTQLEGYIGTWSALGAARESEVSDPFTDFTSALLAVWPVAGQRRAVRWPLVVRVGRKDGNGR